MIVRRKITMTAATARLIIDKVIKPITRDHQTRCVPQGGEQSLWCRHSTSGALDVVELVEQCLQIHGKRATLTLICPYTSGADDCYRANGNFRALAERLRLWAPHLKASVGSAVERIAGEIERFATRNPLEILGSVAEDDQPT